MNKDLHQLFQEYISECRYSRRYRNETLRGSESIFNVFLSLSKTTSPKDITVETLNYFFHLLQTRKRIVGKGIEKSGIKDSTLKTYWSKLSSFLNWLQQNNHIQENPLSKIKPPEPVYDDKRSLSKEEVNKIISAIILHSHTPLIQKRDLAIVGVLIFCGLRKSELLSLEIRDLNLDQKVLTIRGETSKSKRTRLIPICAPLYIYLEEYLSIRKKKRYSTSRLFVSSTCDSGLGPDGIKKWVLKLSSASGVKFHLHRFRHTFACNLANQNISAIKIQKLMGHSDLRMTERYLRSLTVDDMREDISKMSLDTFI